MIGETLKDEPQIEAIVYGPVADDHTQPKVKAIWSIIDWQQADVARINSDKECRCKTCRLLDQAKSEGSGNVSLEQEKISLIAQFVMLAKCRCSACWRLRATMETEPI